MPNNIRGEVRDLLYDAFGTDPNSTQVDMVLSLIKRREGEAAMIVVEAVEKELGKNYLETDRIKIQKINKTRIETDLVAYTNTGWNTLRKYILVVLDEMSTRFGQGVGEEKV